MLGVSDAPPRRVVGTSAFDAPAKTAAGVFERLRIKVTATKLAHPHGRVLVFAIPSRGKGHPIEYEGRYLMRAGESLVAMTPGILKSIFSEGEDEFEARIALTQGHPYRIMTRCSIYVLFRGLIFTHKTGEEPNR